MTTNAISSVRGSISRILNADAPRNIAACALALTLLFMVAGCDSGSGRVFIPRRTATPTTTLIVTPTSTPTATATGSTSPTPTATPTATGSGSPTPTATPTATACTDGSEFTIVNNNSYPVWLAESYQGSTTTIVTPPGNNWEIAANSSVPLCMPSGWNGRFWPRTECNFDSLFSNDSGYQSCTTTADCTINNTADNPHICYGGECLLTCNTGSTPFCQGASGLDNSASVCAPVTSSTASTPPMVCTFPNGTVCKTGDCQGLTQCYGTWDQNTANVGAAAPVALFEAAFTGLATVNYDVSLVNGYNTQIKVQPSVPASGASCYQPSCTSDLNSSCPTDLQFTEAPTATVSSIPCGTGTYCQSRACVGETCVVGCWDPGDACQPPNIPSANLMCSATLPSGATYEDMYLVKDTDTGVKMSSGNQGNATCWGDVDCPVGETCEMAGEAGLPPDFPVGVGVCASAGVFAGQFNCLSNPADVGNSCGGYQSDGYPGALGYTCISTGAGASDVACVPAYNPPVSGLGTSESATDQPDLLTGVGSFINPDWLTASTQAGGGTTPYYETFADACPHQYGFSYDDLAGGLACSSGGPNVNFTISFGP